MASLCDNKTALTAMVSVLTAFTSAVAISTATVNTSLLQQLTNEDGVATGLTSAEREIVTAVGVAIGVATPAATIHSLDVPYDTRQIFGAMTSVLAGLSSAVGVTTGNLATQLSSLNTADTGMSLVEKGLVTLFSASVGTSAPAANAHTQV